MASKRETTPGAKAKAKRAQVAPAEPEPVQAPPPVPMAKHVERTGFAWASYESHDMTLSFVPPFAFPANAQTVEEKLAGPLVGLNPVYWAVWAASMPPLVVGKWLHGLFGQDGPVRADENHQEHEVRVQWIYFNDALFFKKFVLDMRNIYIHVDEKNGWEGADADDLFRTAGIGALMLGAMLVGNFTFYQAMQTKSADQVRASIVGNIFFAIIMAAMLSKQVMERYETWTKTNRLDFDDVQAEFVLHSVSVIFAIMCLPLYYKLWNAYADNQEPSSVLGLARGLAPFAVLLALMAHAYGTPKSIIWEAFG